MNHSEAQAVRQQAKLCQKKHVSNIVIIKKSATHKAEFFSLSHTWWGAPAGMKMASPAHCTSVYPCTEYSRSRRSRSVSSRYQLWSWIGSWWASTGSPISRPTYNYQSRQAGWSLKTFLAAECLIKQTLSPAPATISTAMYCYVLQCETFLIHTVVSSFDTC